MICISLPNKCISTSPETPSKLLLKCKVHSFFIVSMRNGSTSLVALFVCCDKIYKGQPKQTHHIGGDGNCMFRSVSYVMTGSQEHYLEVRAKTLEHMETIAPLTLDHIRGRSGAAMSKCSSLKEYIQYTNMDKQDTWGTEIEQLVLSHLLKTSIYTYLTTDKNGLYTVHPSWIIN